MANQKPLIKLDLPVYTLEEVDRILVACKSLDCSGSELLKIALDIYLAEHGF